MKLHQQLNKVNLVQSAKHFLPTNCLLLTLIQSSTLQVLNTQNPNSAQNNTYKLCSTDTSYQRRVQHPTHDTTLTHVITFYYVIFLNYYYCQCVSVVFGVCASKLTKALKYIKIHSNKSQKTITFSSS